MVFLSLGFWAPRSPTLHIALMAFAFSATIEFFQLYHAPWIDSVRATLPGRLILGSGLSWIDILAYAVGISFGALTERVLFARPKKENAGPS